jgi:hypothetical protein
MLLSLKTAMLSKLMIFACTVVLSYGANVRLEQVALKSEEMTGTFAKSLRKKSTSGVPLLGAADGAIPSKVRNSESKVSNGFDYGHPVLDRKLPA